MARQWHSYKQGLARDWAKLKHPEELGGAWGQRFMALIGLNVRLFWAGLILALLFPGSFYLIYLGLFLLLGS